MERFPPHGMTMQEAVELAIKERFDNVENQYRAVQNHLIEVLDFEDNYDSGILYKIQRSESDSEQRINITLLDLTDYSEKTQTILKRNHSGIKSALLKDSRALYNHEVEQFLHHEDPTLQEYGKILAKLVPLVSGSEDMLYNYEDTEVAYDFEAKPTLEISTIDTPLVDTSTVEVEVVEVAKQDTTVVIKKNDKKRGRPRKMV